MALNSRGKFCPLFGCHEGDIAYRAAEALSMCRFYPGSWAKKFARDIWDRVREHGNLTTKQHAWLWKLVWQYRGQIKNREIIEHAMSRMGEGEANAEMVDWIEQNAESQQ